MTKTTNYNLNQWGAADKIKRADFNADNATIDAALKTVAAAAGNCLIYQTQRTGAGTTSPVTVTVPKGKPMVLFIASGSHYMISWRNVLKPCSVSFSSDLPTVSWGEHSVTWNGTYNSITNFDYLSSKYQIVILSAADA